jgi:hypothetical protein
MIRVQYPPDPPRPCGSDPIDMGTGEGRNGRSTARQWQKFHRGNGAEAAVYRRTWTPGPWVAVDPQPKED